MVQDYYVDDLNDNDNMINDDSGPHQQTIHYKGANKKEIILKIRCSHIVQACPNIDYISTSPNVWMNKNIRIWGICKLRQHDKHDRCRKWGIMWYNWIPIQQAWNHQIIGFNLKL